MTNFGTLYIVATPIGNLEDITLRAINTLKQVDTIICEDTRVSKKLLDYLGINKPLISYNNFNENNKTEYVIKLLLQGTNLALISDAGTPLISDPGFNLIKECYNHNIKVTSIPGACSLIVALTLSSLPLNNFSFIGFLDKSSHRQQELFHTFKNLNHTLAFFESPRRIKNTLQNIQTALGAKQIVVIARELTKIYEEIKIDTTENLIDFYNNNKALGEMIVILKPKTDTTIETQDIIKIIAQQIDSLKPTELAKNLAKEFKMDKNEIYKLILQHKANK